MFGDPGRKIKVVAFVLFAVSVVVSVVLAVIIAARSSFLLCLLMLIGGPLAGYAGALVLAGFGELVENSGKTNRSPDTERSAYIFRRCLLSASVSWLRTPAERKNYCTK